jgi:hypothetical protein
MHDSVPTNFCAVHLTLFDSDAMAVYAAILNVRERALRLQQFLRDAVAVTGWGRTRSRRPPPSEARSTIAGTGSAGVLKRELAGRRERQISPAGLFFARRRIDRLGGVKLQREPRDSSHRSIGGFLQIVRGRTGMVCGRLIECISQSLEGFQNPDASCWIEPGTV